MKRIFILLCLLLGIGTLSGCGGNSHDYVVNPGTITAPTTTSEVTVKHVLTSARAIPANVTNVRATGLSSDGDTLYGPTEQPLQQENVFNEVPITVTTFELEYLANGVVIGTFLAPVTLVENGNFIIDNPNFVDATPVATSLRFLKPPSDGLVSTPLVKVEVQVLDQLGQPFTDATSVTLTLATNPTAATLGGTLTVTSQNGIASFQDLTISATGTGYQLLASSTGLASRLSQAFAIGTLTEAQDSGQSFLTYLYGSIPGVPAAVAPVTTVLWDLDLDFSLNDGLGDTWDGAMALAVGGTYFPYDQDDSELTFLTPLVTPPAPQVSSRFAAPQGSFSAIFSPGVQSSLSQTIDLSGSSAPITLSWSDYIDTGNDSIISDNLPFSYKVTIKDTNDNVLATAFQDTNPWFDPENRTFDLSSYAGQTIKVHFELNNYAPGSSDVIALVDNVSILDGSGAEKVVNGDFETGELNGWATTAASLSQHIRSGSRVVNGLTVTRTTYTRPDRPWIRYYDEFTNNTGGPITLPIEYASDLGASSSDNNNAFVPGTNEQAIVSSGIDLDDGDSDLGFVFGSGATLIGYANDSNEIDWSYNNVTVAPGETIAFCIFVLQDGARSLGGYPTRLGDEALHILTNFRRDFSLLEGLSSTQLARIQNI